MNLPPYDEVVTDDCLSESTLSLLINRPEAVARDKQEHLAVCPHCQEELVQRKRREKAVDRLFADCFAR